MKDDHVVRLSTLGPLHDLMLKICPATEDGVKSIPTLAKAAGYTPQALYKMIRTKKVSPGAAQRLVDASDGLATLEDFHPYIFV